MPKAAVYTLLWSAEQECYIIREQGKQEQSLCQDDGKTWDSWITARTSFSFQGRSGQLNVLKEARPRGEEGYWYAYQRQGKRMRKKYIGRNNDLTLARLEAIASDFSMMVSKRPAPQPGRSHVERKMRVLEDVEERGHQIDRLSPASEASSLSGPDQVPLLAPKIRLPRLSTALVVRDRLLTRLDTALDCALTLLIAPAGSGKTTLVRQWIAERWEHQDMARQISTGRVRVAWVSLDAGDNDPVRFWRYVLTACQVFYPDPGFAALNLLANLSQTPFKPMLLEDVLTTFLNALTRCEEGSLLVLEDYQAITAPQIHALMTFFLDHLPSTMHLIMITRSEPDLPLARLRARGELCELHAADLRFSQAETVAFLQQSIGQPCQFSFDALQQLDTHLEGWAAGLRFLALSLQRLTDVQQIEHLLKTFAGGHRTLQEYFVSEVLSTQPEPLQDFLLRTSVLARLTGLLCDALTGQSDGSQMLSTLDRAGLFLEPLDECEEWYRYHALFAEAMQQEARRRLGLSALQALYKRASIWFEQHGMLPEAVEAALQIQDMARAAMLIEQVIEKQVANSRITPRSPEFHTLRRWLEQLPETLLSEHPLLCYSYAIALLFIIILDQRPLIGIKFERFMHLLGLAEQGWRREGKKARLAEVFALRALVISQRGDLLEAASWARLAYADLEPEDLTWRCICLMVILGIDLLEGRIVVAHEKLLEARSLALATDQKAFIRPNTTVLARLLFGSGELHQAARYYQQVLDEARQEDDRDDQADALLGLSQLSYEWNKLDEAKQQAQEVISLGQRFENEEFKFRATFLLARVEHACGRTASALQLLSALINHMPALSADAAPSSLNFWLARELLAWQVRYQLALGDLAAVRYWVSQREKQDGLLPYLLYEEEERLIARWLLAQGRNDEALVLLTRLLDATQQPMRAFCEIKTRTLLSLAYVACKQEREAQFQLRVALSLARPEGYLRLFLDEGEPIIMLLHSLQPYLDDQALIIYLQTIIQAFEQGQPTQKQITHPVASILVEPLSVQELRVLRLLVVGRTNHEIADELVISINTVKTHVQRIYRKLNVRGRVEVRTAARQFHLC